MRDPINGTEKRLAPRYWPQPHRPLPEFARPAKLAHFLNVSSHLPDTTLKAPTPWNPWNP